MSRPFGAAWKQATGRPAEQQRIAEIKRRHRDREIKALMAERKAALAGAAAREIKIAGGLQGVSARTISGYGARFGNVDSHGDIIRPGAFAQTLAWWRQVGELPALLDHHDGNRTTAVIGRATELREDASGLFGSWELIAGDEGERIAARVRQGLVKGLSIGYRVLRKSIPTASERAAGAKRILDSLWLDEVSLVQSPANKLATVEAVKLRDDFETAAWLDEVDIGTLTRADRLRVLELRARKLALEE
jgi:uncharacterized protein